MTTIPFFSIIVPNYQHAKFLGQRLGSIFNQTFQNFEIILLDDASTDNGENILVRYKTHPKVSFLEINKRNSGSPFKQWMKGMEIAKGEYIWIAESDDFCENNFLEKIFNFIQESKNELGAVYTQSVDVDVEDNKLSNRIAWTSEFQPNIWKNNFVRTGKEFITHYLKVKNVIPNASAVVFKKSLLENRPFTEDIYSMTMCGDWSFWISILPQTHVGFISEPLNFFRIHCGVSRLHNSRIKKIKRLQEESLIRKRLRKYNVQQGSETEKLYSAWFDLHGVKNIFNSSFYDVLVYRRKILIFLINFLKKKYYARK